MLGRAQALVLATALFGDVHATSAQRSVPAAAPTLDVDKITISVTAIDPIDKAGNLDVLITVTDTTYLPLVLGGGQRVWGGSATVVGGTSGMGWATGVSDGVRPGDRVCPSSDVVVVPPGNSVALFESVDQLKGLPRGVPVVDLDVRLFVYPSSLHCGPAETVERTVRVAFDARTGGAPAKAWAVRR